MLKREMINMKNDDVDASPLTFKLYELKILHNMLVESLEEYPEYPMDVVILNKIKEKIKEKEIRLVVDAIFGHRDEEQNYWEHVENQYELETNTSQLIEEADDLPF